MSEPIDIRSASIRDDEAHPFWPATVHGLAKRLWATNAELGELRREQETLRSVLDAWCRKTGEAIEVEGQPALRLVSEFEWDAGRMIPREVWKLRFDRKKRRSDDGDDQDDV